MSTSSTRLPDVFHKKTRILEIRMRKQEQRFPPSKTETREEFKRRLARTARNLSTTFINKSIGDMAVRWPPCWKQDQMAGCPGRLRSGVSGWTAKWPWDPLRGAGQNSLFSSVANQWQTNGKPSGKPSGKPFGCIFSIHSQQDNFV